MSSPSDATTPGGANERTQRNVAGTPAPPNAENTDTDDSALRDRTGLTQEQIDELGREFDAMRERIQNDLGEADANYIRNLVRVQRALEAAGRGMLFLGFLPPAWLGGVTALSLSKILDNMEIGHNVMHGQYDFMNDPEIHSGNYEWDTAAPSENWKLSHNFMHHTYTNILGMDRDVGYGLLRMTEDQEWEPRDLANPIYAFLLALLFQWGVAAHDLEIEKIRSGENEWEDVRDIAKVIAEKSAKQAGKDYVLFPLLAGPGAPFVLAGNLTANLVRNVWAFTIIFCGHFPDGIAMFTQEEVEKESRGGWYLRQMIGSSNVKGSTLFHIIGGNLGHQIEHHLFPDLPSRRYAAMSADVKDICTRYGLPYNTGTLRQQFGSVVRKIFRLALPNASPGPDHNEGVELHPPDAPVNVKRIDGFSIARELSQLKTRVTEKVG